MNALLRTLVGQQDSIASSWSRHSWHPARSLDRGDAIVRDRDSALLLAIPAYQGVAMRERPADPQKDNAPPFSPATMASSMMEDTPQL
jgi:hypothetical protein